MEVLSNTTMTTMTTMTSMTTKAVLHAVSDSQWWRTSINYLRPLHGPGPGSALKGLSGENGDMEKQGCNPFYEHLFDNPYVAESEDIYMAYDHVPQEHFGEVLLRTGKLAETKSEGQNLFPATEVLLQLASDALPKDMTLALAYLLALPQVLDANKCFEKQPHSALTLQLAAYYYALQIYSRLAPCFKDKCHVLYRADPKDLIKLVTKRVTDTGFAAWPEGLEKIIGQLHLYNQRLTDFTQAQILQGLGRGVDVQRFSADEKYKRETILGLAETLEENVYKISLSFAQRYNVPLWEVCMTHLEFLFTDSGLSTKEIESRSEALGLFATLKSEPEAFCAHMTKYVYPSMEGTDLLRLLYYFSLLEACGCSHPQATIPPETHVKLLKKLKAVATGVNYRKLIDEDSSPLLALEPVLNSQNVLSVSKLAPKLPLPGGGVLSPSAVHAIWLVKLFWSGDPQVLKRPPQNDGDFLHAYDTCAKYLDRLFPADAVAFVDAVTFSPEAASRLSIDTRSEVTRRALKAVRQISEKMRKKGTEEAENSPGSFEEALRHLQQSLAHLETLGHSFILSLRDSEQEQLQKYSLLYDLSRSEEEKIRQLTVAMLIDGQPLHYVQQILHVVAVPLDISPRSAVQDAVGRIVLALSGNEAALIEDKDPLQILKRIVTSVHTNVQTGGGLVSSDDLLDWLRTFCGDPAVPVKPRIEVLQILEQNFHLSDQDSRLLVFFRSQAVLKSCWPDRQLEIGDVECEDKRYRLFVELLSASVTWVEMEHLMLLLLAWPPMAGETLLDPNPTEHPWVMLTAAILSRCSFGTEEEPNAGVQVLRACRSLYTSKHKLPVQCVRRISDLLLKQPEFLLPALKLMTESRDPELLGLTLDQISAINTVDESNCDGELLSLLLDAGLLMNCVGTLLYPRLVHHLLTHHRERGWDVEEIARQMHQVGHTCEAGSLLMSCRGTHPGQVTFNLALATVKRWL